LTQEKTDEGAHSIVDSFHHCFVVFHLAGLETICWLQRLLLDSLLIAAPSCTEPSAWQRGGDVPVRLRRNYWLISLQFAVRSILSETSGDGAEKSPTHRLSRRLAGYLRGIGVYHSESV
jgi:hypothetical protein